MKMGNPTWRSVENERGKQEEVEEEGREDEGLETLIADVWNICVWTELEGPVIVSSRSKKRRNSRTQFMGSGLAPSYPELHRLRLPQRLCRRRSHTHSYSSFRYLAQSVGCIKVKTLLADKTGDPKAEKLSLINVYIYGPE